MANESPCPGCEGKGYVFDHPEVDDPDDFDWCATCFGRGVIEEAS